MALPETILPHVQVRALILVFAVERHPLFGARAGWRSYIFGLHILSLCAHCHTLLQTSLSTPDALKSVMFPTR